MVTWKTSDPVTGTVVSYTNDGTANTGYVSEQTEPLGQSISLDPPPVEPEPPTYEAYLFSAREPEWQCSLPFSFQPVSCQIRAEIAASETDFGMHTLYDPDKRPGDPSYINVDEQAMAVAEASSMAGNTLNKTRKPTLRMPFSAVYTKGSSKCAEGPINCEVTVSITELPVDIQQRLDTSYADQPPRGGGVTSQQAQNSIVAARDQLANFLKFKAKQCADALKALGLTDNSILVGFDNNNFMSGGSSNNGAVTRWHADGTSDTTTQNGVIDFITNGQPMGWLIHEVGVHAVRRLRDSQAYNRLLRAQRAGHISGLTILATVTDGPNGTASPAISSYLNSACQDTIQDSPLPSGGNSQGSTSA